MIEYKWSIGNCLALLLSLIILVSCSNNESKKFQDLKNHRFSDLTFNLPGVFVETSIDELIESWSNTDSPQEVVNSKIEYYEFLRPREQWISLYVDSTNLNSTVMVFVGPYIKINKWTSQQMFQMLEKRLRSEADELGVEFKPIENNFYPLNNGNDLLKIKFEWNSTTEQTFGTQYLLNTNESTYGFIVMNDYDDFEAIIRSGRQIQN